MTENERSLRVAESLTSQREWNGRIFIEGEYVAILDGKVIAVSSNPDDAIAALRAKEPDLKRGMVVEVSSSVVDVIR